MKALSINGKEYKLEYNFEAAYDGGCVEDVMKLVNVTNANGEEDRTKAVSGIPKVVVSLFYYGLLEHNPVESEKDAKEIVKEYFAEHKGDSFYTLAEVIMDCMADDGFLALIGIVDEEPQEDNTIPMPQDHKKKQTK